VEEHRYNETEEVSIVSSADTVVQPQTMVIELVSAPLAPSTVLGILVNVRIAQMTEVLVVTFLKILVGHLAVPLLPDSQI